MAYYGWRTGTQVDATWTKKGYRREHPRRGTWVRYSGRTHPCWSSRTDRDFWDHLSMFLTLLGNPAALTDPLTWAELLGYQSEWLRRTVLLSVTMTLFGSGTALGALAL